MNKRTLTQWRKQALQDTQYEKNLIEVYEGTAPNLAKGYIEAQKRILQLTQELMDLELLEEKQ